LFPTIQLLPWKILQLRRLMPYGTSDICFHLLKTTSCAPNKHIITCEICGSHSSVAEESSLLGCYDVLLGCSSWSFKESYCLLLQGHATKEIKPCPIWLYISTDNDIGLGERVMRESGQWCGDMVHWLLVWRGG
jgi:hypothetical protein